MRDCLFTSPWRRYIYQYILSWVPSDASVPMDKEEAGVKIPLRLHVHKERNQVIFAEANSDFVDTLFSFLTLPMGTIVRLLKNQCDLQPGETAGCFGNLYESVEKLDASHLWSEGCKEKLLNPRNAAEARCEVLKLNVDDTRPTTYLVCLSSVCTKPEISLNIPASSCSCCGITLSRATYVLKNMRTSDKNKGTGGGFVTETASFIVTDKLEVIPNLPTTVFELFEKWGISDLDAVDEINLNIGYKEMLNLLKCSLVSGSPLTDTFVSKISNFGCLMKSGLLNFEIENDVGKLEEKKERTMTIKLIIRKSNKNFLFAYAEENFVDFLFSLLTIPLGGVSHLLRGNLSRGSVGNLYRSLSTLKLDRHIKSQDLKSMLVDPRVAALHLSKNHILSLSETKAEYYRDNTKIGHRVYVEDRSLYLATNKVKCDSYKNCVQMSLKDPNFKGQYTRPSVFIVTDDMHVSPLSLFSVVSFLRRQAIPLSDVEEQVISIGMTEAQKILKASFESTSVFTNAGINILPNPIKQEQ